MTIQRLITLSLFVATCAAGVGCASPTETADEGAEVSADELRQIPPTGLSRDKLKSRVIGIASANTLRTDEASLRAVRGQLNRLVADLSRKYKTPAVATELENGFEGTWKQLWTDDFRGSPPGAPAGDPAAVYQVITKKGYFYNFSNLIVPTPTGAPRVAIGAFLRGEAAQDAANAHVLNIKFTKLGALPTSLPDANVLGALVEDIESGKVAATTGRPGAGAPGSSGAPSAGGAPGTGGAPAAGGPPPGATPVGQEGKLQNLYLDSDLRVALGGTSAQSYNKLYILVRVGH